MGKTMEAANWNNVWPSKRPGQTWKIESYSQQVICCDLSDVIWTVNTASTRAARTPPKYTDKIVCGVRRRWLKERRKEGMEGRPAASFYTILQGSLLSSEVIMRKEMPSIFALGQKTAYLLEKPSCDPSCSFFL